MSNFIVFIVSLILLILLFLLKDWEIKRGQKIFLEKIFLKTDVFILNILVKVKYWWSHINFRNTILFFTWIVKKVKQLIVAIKKRFDHKQVSFFVRRDLHGEAKNNGMSSFFLKDVSDYKKSLQEDNQN